MSDHNQLLFVKAEDGSYSCVDNDPAWVAKVAYVIDNGPSFANLLGSALVRRGRAGDWHYYPAPFLFLSEQERDLAAERRGKRAPHRYWVRRKLRMLYSLARREEKMVA